MEITTLLLQQFTDVFRLGLLVGLIYTTVRTRQQTGVLVPLLAGVIFVAVIIPSTMPVSGVSYLQAVTTGIFVNAVVVAVFWFAWRAYSTSRHI
jgi:hypothetical protein